MTKVKLLRPVTIQECDWLTRDFKKDEILYLFYGHTYGCITDEGVACCEKEDGPFFEIPKNAISEDYI